MVNSRKYTRRFAIRSTETDVWDRLHPDCLFSMMQEAAAEHAQLLGTGPEQLEPVGLVFLLNSVSLEMDRFPVWGDELVIHTWCREVQNLYFIRDHQIHDGRGNILGRATSSWFLSDKLTHRPARSSALSLDYREYVHDERALGHNPPRFKKGQLAFPEQAGYRVTADFSDIDRNRHVNNTRYVAWSMNSMYQQSGLQEQACIRRIDINFLSEVKYGEELRIVGADEQNPDGQVPGSQRFALEGQGSEGQPFFRAAIYYDI